MEDGTLQIVALSFGVLYAACEVIAVSPLKSNTVFQLVFNIAKWGINTFKKKPSA